MSTAASASVADLSPADFAFVRDLVRRESANALEAGKEYLVTSRLRPLARQVGLPDVATLVARVRAQPHSALAADVVDAMTTNETSFFRDVHPFDSLRDEVLPELVAARRARRTLRIWCGAASSGQEPYSVAMVLADHFPELESWDVDILGTDISRAMLAKAVRAEYSQIEVDRGVPAAALRRHFVRHGTRWRLTEAITRRVRFAHLNLAAPWPVLPRFDLVLLRNVLIYFDLPTKADVLRRVRRHLADDGYLALGGSETTVGVDTDLQRHVRGRSTWYRAGDGACRRP